MWEHTHKQTTVTPPPSLCLIYVCVCTSMLYVALYQYDQLLLPRESEEVFPRVLTDDFLPPSPPPLDPLLLPPFMSKAKAAISFWEWLFYKNTSIFIIIIMLKVPRSTIINTHGRFAVAFLPLTIQGVQYNIHSNIPFFQQFWYLILCYGVKFEHKDFHHSHKDVSTGGILLAFLTNALHKIQKKLQVVIASS